MKDFRTCMKGLAAMGRPLRGRILVSCVIGVFRIAASMAFVWVCKALVDIATGESSEPLGLYVGLMIGIMLAQVILSTAFSWWEGMIVTKTQNSFRAEVFGHVLASEWHGREAFHSGDMVNRLEEDTRVVVDLLCVRVPDFSLWRHRDFFSSWSLPSCGSSSSLCPSRPSAARCSSRPSAASLR